MATVFVSLKDWLIVLCVLLIVVLMLLLFTLSAVEDIVRDLRDDDVLNDSADREE